jgi:hypothetical protein
MTIRAADAASLIGKINSMSHAFARLHNREFHTQFPPKKINDWWEESTLILIKHIIFDEPSGAQTCLTGGSLVDDRRKPP